MSSTRLNVRNLPLFVIVACLLGFPIYAWLSVFPYFFFTFMSDPWGNLSPGVNLSSTVMIIGGGYGLVCCCWFVTQLARYASNHIPFWIQAGLLLLTVLSIKMSVEVMRFQLFEAMVAFGFLGPPLCILLGLGLVRAIRRELLVSSKPLTALHP